MEDLLMGNSCSDVQDLHQDRHVYEKFSVHAISTFVALSKHADRSWKVERLLKSWVCHEIRSLYLSQFEIISFSFLTES